MTKYTAEDFAKAEFARHEEGMLAVRSDPGGTRPWSVNYGWASDASMAVDPGWSIVRDAESLTAREHLDAAWEKSHETDVIPAGAGCITKWADGRFSTDHEGVAHDLPVKFEGVERRLLDPPPAPAWHNARIVRATHILDDSPSKWAHTEAGDWVRLSTASGVVWADAEDLRDVTVIVGADGQTKGQD